VQGEATAAGQAAGSELDGGAEVVGGTNPEVDVDVALDGQERAGIGSHTEGNVTVYVGGELARLGAAWRIPIDLLRSAAFLLSSKENAAAIGSLFRPVDDAHHAAAQAFVDRLIGNKCADHRFGLREVVVACGPDGKSNPS